jgi:hypothetical protein
MKFPQFALSVIALGGVEQGIAAPELNDMKFSSAPSSAG